MSITETAQTKSKKAVDEAEKSVAKLNKDMAEIAGEQTDKLASTAQDRASDFVGSVKNAVHASADSFRKDGYTAVGDMIERFAGGTEAVDDRIGAINTADAANSVQSFIREKPLLAFGGLAAVGFVLAAAMQKTASDRQQPAQPGPQTAKGSRTAAPSGGRQY